MAIVCNTGPAGLETPEKLLCDYNSARGKSLVVLISLFIQLFIKCLLCARVPYSEDTWVHKNKVPTEFLIFFLLFLQDLHLWATQLLLVKMLDILS